MNVIAKLRGRPDFLLRIPLGLIFLYFALDKILYPQGTIAIIQNSFFAPLIPQTVWMMYLIATVETLIGILLIFNIQTRKTALLAALLLVGIIVVARVPQDIVLFFVALVVSMVGKDSPWKKSST